MKHFMKRIFVAISVAAAIALTSATSMAQTIALTPGAISTIAGVQGATTNPANGTVASGNSIGAPVSIAIAPKISGAGGDIYFDNCTTYNCAYNYTLYVIYEGGAAAKAILVADGIASPVVGDIYALTSTNETGPASLAGIAVDSYGNVLVADWSYNRVYMYYAGTVSGQGTNPADALLTADGNAGVYGLHAGYTYHVADGSHVVGNAPTTPAPRDVYVDSAENIFFSDYGSNEVELIYNTTGTSANAILTAEGYTSLRQGYTYIVAGGYTGTITNDYGENVVAYNGATNTATTGANGPFGISANPATGDIYFVDYTSLKIKKLSGSTAKLTTVGGPAAGTATTAGHAGDGGLATAAQIGSAGPHGLKADAGGNIYFADSANSAIRRIDANGYISTLAGINGTSGTYAGNGGNATAATMNVAYMMTLDASGNLYIADMNNDLIHKLTVNAAIAGSVIGTAVNNSGVFTYEGNFAFGNVADNAQGATATALITNITSSSVTPSSISIPFGFTQVLLGNSDVPDCSTSTAIVAGRSCTLALAFFPYQPIAYSGNATVTTGGQTVTIPVTGTGTAGATTTTTALSVNNSNPVLGTSITFTATVTPTAATGRVSFWDNSTTFLGYGNMSSGVATYSTNSLALGSHSVTAIYGGNATYKNSTSSAVGVTVVSGTVATPTFSPAAGGYSSSQSVTISDTTGGATIHYTTDGSTPTAGSPTYSTPITVSVSETVKAIGVETGWANSAVGSAAYTLTVATPTFSPVAGTYGSAQTVTISDATTGAVIHYTTDGSTPTGSSTTYSTAITVSVSETVKAIGIITGWTNSAVGSAAYTITAAAYPVTDSFSGSGALSANWTNTQAYVGLSYPPVPLVRSSSTVVPNTAASWGLATYTAATFTTDQYAQVKFVAHNAAGGWTGPCVEMNLAGTGYCWTADSGTIVAYYTGVWDASTGIACPTPASGDIIQLSITGSTLTCQDVTASTSASGSTVSGFWVSGTPLPGLMVDTRNSSVYALTTFQADCIPTCGTGGSTVATPTFSPSGGTYYSAQTVTISDSTTGATIHYTTDGSTPTAGSATYSTPISVSASETVKAIGVESGWTNSAIGSAAYTLTVATPTFSPVAGTYGSAQSVTISTTTSGATLHYTTDGSTPSGTSATYSTPINVSVSETVKAIGLETGYTSSAVGSAAYTISSGGKTVSSVAISPQGGALQAGSTIQFSVVCTYTDLSTDNCASAGGASWTTTATTGMTVSSSGLMTYSADPGAGGAGGHYVIVAAGGITDRAEVYVQHPGDTWYQYPTPSNNFGNVAVGSTVTMGSGLSINDPNMQHTPQPFQGTCSWSSSNTSIATVDRHGQVTAVAPGTVTITCGRAGNAVFGSSTESGWSAIAPGNLLNLTVVAGGAGNTTWYVLPGGGTLYDATYNPNGQCNGQTNQTYAAAGGSGVNKPCGVGNIRYLWADGNTYGRMVWKINGGDTVIVAQTAAGVGYNTGLDNYPGTWNPTNCAGNPYCSMPSIPSGTAARHTKILGANYASCHADSAKTLLHVSYSGADAFDVTDSQFVDIACFEITDEASCAQDGNYTNSCYQSSLNYGMNGIGESALTSDVTYTDIFIHGLAGDGIHGATGVGVVADHIHIRAMPDSGINMDDDPWNGGNISVAGGLTLTNSITEFTGCVEEYPVVHNYPYIECRDQNTGSYADGFGTASTTGNWYFDHDTWQYNYQDGLDLLHSGMQNLTVTNSLSMANDGQAYKIGSGDKVVFQNNIAMVNCNRIAYVIGDEPSSAIVPGVNVCRAGGDWTVFSFTNQGSYQIQDNTFVGYGATPFDFGCEGGWDFCQNAASAFENNIIMGYSDTLYNGGQEPGLFYQESSQMPPNNGWAVRDHNLYFQSRYGCPSPLLTGEVCADPKFVNEPASPMSVESALDGFNFTPASGSPVVGAGVAIPGITLDYNGTTRPNPPSIGAIE